VVIGRVADQGAADLAEIGKTSSGIGCVTHSGRHRDQDGEQHHDDPDDDQEFDQRKSPWWDRTRGSGWNVHRNNLCRVRRRGPGGRKRVRQWGPQRGNGGHGMRRGPRCDRMSRRWRMRNGVRRRARRDWMSRRMSGCGRGWWRMRQGIRCRMSGRPRRGRRKGRTQ
jgi:hypothetical protein